MDGGDGTGDWRDGERQSMGELRWWGGEQWGTDEHGGRDGRREDDDCGKWNVRDMEWIGPGRDGRDGMGGECVAIGQQHDDQGRRIGERIEHGGVHYCECGGRGGDNEWRVECGWGIGEQYCAYEHGRDGRRDGDDCGSRDVEWDCGMGQVGIG